MWLESHANLARHPKTRRLMKRLGWSLPDTIGNLHLFWYWALDFAPTGNLTPYTPEELTADLDLLGVSPEQFIESMIQAGFLDKEEDSVLIHDWVDYKRPKPRRKSAHSFRPAETNQDRPVHRPSPSTQAERQPQVANSHAIPTFSPRPVQTGHHPEQAVPPRGDDTGTQPHKLRPGVPGEDLSEGVAPLPPSPHNENEPSPVETDFRSEYEPQGAVRIDCTERCSSRQGGSEVSGDERNQNTSPTTDSDKNTSQTPIEDDFRIELPSKLYRLPGFAKHWWPLYLDFHKKSGTPLSADARAKFLARLEKEPLTAIAQIKRVITHAVHNGIPWTGLLEHAP